MTHHRHSNAIIDRFMSMGEIPAVEDRTFGAAMTSFVLILDGMIARDAWLQAYISFSERLEDSHLPHVPKFTPSHSNSMASDLSAKVQRNPDGFDVRVRNLLA
jgi:hypothetical protein